MKTIAFYSYKGGVGRTLLVANTAQFLALSGCKVVVLDLDLEAPGLHYKLGGGDLVCRAEGGQLLGVVNFLNTLLSQSQEQLHLSELAVPIGLPLGSTGSLRLIAAGSAPAQSYWDSLGLLTRLLHEPGGAGQLPDALLELQAGIEAEFLPDYLLVDSRTGITELGGLATSLLADQVVCLTHLAQEALSGTKVVLDALRRVPRLQYQGV